MTDNVKPPSMEQISEQTDTRIEKYPRPSNARILGDLYQDLEGLVERKRSEERFDIARNHNVEEGVLAAQIEWSYETKDGFRQPDATYERWEPLVEEYFNNTRWITASVDAFLESRTGQDVGERCVLAVRFLLGGVVTEEERYSDNAYNSLRQRLSGDGSRLERLAQRGPDDSGYREARYLVETYLAAPVVSELSEEIIAPLKEVVFETIERFRARGDTETADEWGILFMERGVLTGDEPELEELDEKYPSGLD